MGIRLIKRFAFKRDITRSVCIVVQRMAHHNHLVHLNHPQLSCVNLRWQKVSRASYSTYIRLLIGKHPSRKNRIFSHLLGCDTIGSNFNCCTAPGKNICMVRPSLWSRSAPRRSTDYFQAFRKKVLALQICLYWAAVLISTLTALEHLMPVSRMWSIGSLVCFYIISVWLYANITKIETLSYHCRFTQSKPFLFQWTTMTVPPCIMCVQYIGGCSVHQGLFSTSGDTMSTSWGYHEYIGGVQ